MRAHAMTVAGVFALTIAACGQTASFTADAVRHDAEAFFLTTSFSMASAAGHAFSAGSGELLISSDETGVFNAFALDPETGVRTPLTVSESDATFAISWFPADERALVTADEGGDELSHVYVREADGSLTDLTPGENVKAQFYGWSSSGSRLWIATNERDPRAFDLYAYDADSYEREMVFENAEAFTLSQVSADGRWLALVRPRTSADSDIFLADLSGEDSEPHHITPHSGNIDHGVYAFTASSATLVYSTDEHGEFNQAWTHDLQTGERSPLIAAEWDVMYVSFSPSGRYRVSAINDDGRTEIGRAHV